VGEVHLLAVFTTFCEFVIVVLTIYCAAMCLSLFCRRFVMVEVKNLAAAVLLSKDAKFGTILTMIWGGEPEAVLMRNALAVMTVFALLVCVRVLFFCEYWQAVVTVKFGLLGQIVFHFVVWGCVPELWVML